MTKQEILEKVVEIKTDARKIDNVEDIIKSMKTTLLDIDAPIAQKALFVGFVYLLDKAYDDIQFVWLHLYQLRKAINDDMLAERTIDADPEVTADDLPFDGKEEKE